MATNHVGNHSAGPQNVAAGGGPQFNKNDHGPQFNHSTVQYGHPFQDPQAEAAIRLEQEKEECLRSLVFPNIHARRNDIDPAHRNTCDWLFQSPEFRKWKDPAFLPDHNGILWIKGKPGAGKSTLMKHAYRRCQKVIFRDHLIVDFFFNAQGKMLEEHTPLGMLQSIVYKLIRGDDALYEVFIPSYHEKRRASLDGKFLWHQSELKEIIRSMVTRSESRPLLFLIDALDECEELEIRNIIEFLESLSIYASGNNIPLKICISSRHFPNIGIGKFVELRVEKSQEHQADIAQYVNDRLRAKLYTYDIAAEIVKSADNVFLWVAVVVSLLNNAYDEGKGIEATRKILKETPSSLESIFSVILSRNKSELSETVLLLQWVLLSGQPLEPYQLFAAVVGEAPPFKDVAALRIATSSRGLVEIRKGARETVHFIHHSVREFLSRPGTLQELDSTLGPSPVRTTHGRLWARCLFEIEQARSAWAMEKHLAELEQMHPFLLYALRYVLYHAEMALSDDLPKSHKSGDRQLHEDQFASWDTPEPLYLERWVRDSDDWFRWWKELALFDEDDETSLLFPNSVPNSLGGETILCMCAWLGLPKLTGILLEDIDLNTTSEEFSAALQAASSKDHQEIYQLLLCKIQLGGLFGGCNNDAKSKKAGTGHGTKGDRLKYSSRGRHNMKGYDVEIRLELSPPLESATSSPTNYHQGRPYTEQQPQVTHHEPNPGRVERRLKFHEPAGQHSNNAKASQGPPLTYSRQKSSRFRIGAVFKVLWCEPRPATGGSSGYSENALFYQGIRRFIVIREGAGHSICVGIYTYHRQGCLKSGTAAQDHGLVYDELYGNPGLLTDEPELGFGPLPVMILPGLSEFETIDGASRINYAKLHTVEHNLSVQILGSIATEWVEQLVNNVDQAWQMMGKGRRVRSRKGKGKEKARNTEQL